MFRFRKKRRPPRGVPELQRRIDELEAELEAERRKVAVRDSEIAEQAAVIVRNHERVKAETALTIRGRAEQEGLEGLLEDAKRTN